MLRLAPAYNLPALVFEVRADTPEIFKTLSQKSHSTKDKAVMRCDSIASVLGHLGYFPHLLKAPEADLSGKYETHPHIN